MAYCVQWAPNVSLGSKGHVGLKRGLKGLIRVKRTQRPIVLKRDHSGSMKIKDKKGLLDSKGLKGAYWAPKGSIGVERALNVQKLKRSCWAPHRAPKGSLISKGHIGHWASKDSLDSKVHIVLERGNLAQMGNKILIGLIRLKRLH